MSFGHEITGYVFARLDGYTASVYSALAGSWPAQSITALYIVIGGYVIMTGNAGRHAKEMAISMALLVVLQGIVASGYNDWVARPILGSVTGLSQLAINSTGGGGDVFLMLDDGLGQVMTTVDRIEPPGNILSAAWLYLKVGLVSILATIAFSALYIVFMLLYISAFFGIYMMLMVGGIFLWLASFRATRHYTWAWLRAMLNYGLWVFFLSAVMGFFMSSIVAALNDFAKWDIAVDGAFPPSIGKLAFLTLLCAWLLLKTADWASALTGGVSMSPGIVTTGGSLVGGAAQSALRSEGARAAMGAAGGAAMGAGRGIGRGIAGGAVRAFSALRGIK